MPDRMPPDRTQSRRSPRRKLTPPFRARIVRVDGTKQFPCEIIDISENGARLACVHWEQVPGQFFLALSASGSAHRNCTVVWREDKYIGVRFDRPDTDAVPAGQAARKRAPRPPDGSGSEDSSRPQ